MSPSLVRPVRDRLEHGRVIRLVQARCKRRFDPGIKPGATQNVPVGNGASAVFPDVVLTSLQRGHRIETIIEVETGESVNHLEALAQWSHYAKLRAPFHLYVPSSMVDVARRLCEDNQIVVSEIWSFHGLGDDVRFTLVHRSRETTPAPRRPPAAPSALSVQRARAAASARPRKPVVRTAKRSAGAAGSARPARAVKAAPGRKAVKVKKKPARTAKRK